MRHIFSGYVLSPDLSRIPPPHYRSAAFSSHRMPSSLMQLFPLIRFVFLLFYSIPSVPFLRQIQDSESEAGEGSEEDVLPLLFWPPAPQATVSEPLNWDPSGVSISFFALLSRTLSIHHWSAFAANRSLKKKRAVFSCSARRCQGKTSDFYSPLQVSFFHKSVAL